MKQEKEYKYQGDVYKEPLKGYLPEFKEFLRQQRKNFKTYEDYGTWLASHGKLDHDIPLWETPKVKYLCRIVGIVEKEKIKKYFPYQIYTTIDSGEQIEWGVEFLCANPILDIRGNFREKCEFLKYEKGMNWPICTKFNNGLQEYFFIKNGIQKLDVYLCDKCMKEENLDDKARTLEESGLKCI